MFCFLLGLTDVTPARRNAMKKAIGILDECRRKTMNVWKIDRFCKTMYTLCVS